MLEMLTSMALGEEHDTEDMNSRVMSSRTKRSTSMLMGKPMYLNFRECFWRENREYRRAERSCLANMNISSAGRWRPSRVIDHLTDR